MRKVEINNEIVLLRQSVRQARICVINKLVREVKRLRSSHGNDKQLEKCKNKADKLLREISTLKHVKDNEILKFGIIRFDDLQDITQSPHADDRNRIIAKVARYKSLSIKILEFREKYPDYNEHITWTKKKVVLPERKRSGTLNLKNGHSKSLQVNKNSGKENFHKDKKIPYHTILDQDMAQEKSAKSMEAEKRLSAKIKTKTVKEQTLESPKSKSNTKVINSQVIVKKFTEFLQELELSEQNMSCAEVTSDQQTNIRSKSLKEDNDFFLHVHDAVSHSNVTQCVGGTNIDGAPPNVNHKSFMSLHIQDKKKKMNIERVNSERRDYKKQSMDNKHVIKQIGKNALTSRLHKQSKNSSVDKWKTSKIADVSNIESLHPSWLAKKKQQDIMKQGFQGKKIKFNDD